MARKRYSDEDILKLLREIELKLADGDEPPGSPYLKLLNFLGLAVKYLAASASRRSILSAEMFCCTPTLTELSTGLIIAVWLSNGATLGL